MKNFKLNSLKLAVVMVCCILQGLNILAQEVKDHYELSSAMQGNKLYEATQSVKLKNGFRYKAEQNEGVFIGRTVRDMLVPETREKLLSNRFLFSDNDMADWNLDNWQSYLPHDVFRGELDITDIGTLDYTIPIEVPEGVAGLTPHMEIKNSGMANRGNIALGWSLTGMKAIKRKKKDRRRDDEDKAIQWNNTDLFSFNGQTVYTQLSVV